MGVPDNQKRIKLAIAQTIDKQLSSEGRIITQEEFNALVEAEYIRVKHKLPSNIAESCNQQSNSSQQKVLLVAPATVNSNHLTPNPFDKISPHTDFDSTPDKTRPLSASSFHSNTSTKLETYDRKKNHDTPNSSIPLFAGAEARERPRANVFCTSDQTRGRTSPFDLNSSIPLLDVDKPDVVPRTKVFSSTEFDLHDSKFETPGRKITPDIPANSNVQYLNNDEPRHIPGTNVFKNIERSTGSRLLDSNLYSSHSNPYNPTSIDQNTDTVSSAGSIKSDHEFQRANIVPGKIESSSKLNIDWNSLSNIIKTVQETAPNSVVGSSNQPDPMDQPNSFEQDDSCIIIKEEPEEFYADFTDDEIISLLKNFKTLEPLEQKDLIAHMKKLEKDDPERVARLKLGMQKK